MKIGTMCGKHSKAWQDWAGGPDGWGPWNPIPKGVTMKLADEQRAMIAGWCREGRGCSDAE